MASDVFDTNPGDRTESEWRAILTDLIASLSQFLGIDFLPTSWFAFDDTPGAASGGSCVNVRGVSNAPLQLAMCGVVCINVNFGEAAWAGADLLLFNGGRRQLGPNGSDLLALEYTANGWSSRGWVEDEYGEWKMHDTDDRWSIE